VPARARRAGVRAFKTEYSTSDAVNLFSAFPHGTVPLVPQVPVSRAVDDRLCCKVRAMIFVPQYGSGSSPMKSIAYEWAYRYALLLRLDSPVLRDHDRGLPGAHTPYAGKVS